MSPTEQSAQLAGELRGIREKVDEIHHRLFVDNGKPCFQTRLDRHDAAISVLRWIAVTFGTIAAGGVAAFIVATWKAVYRQ